MANILGIVNFENDDVIVEGLSEFRTIPAISFLGRYRVIDFVLSNMVNSKINQIRVLTKEKPRSLIEHIGGGTQYNINSKTGSLDILYSDHPIINKLYFTDIALLSQYKANIEETKADYVVIAPSYMICRLDYQKVIKQLKDSGKEIALVYKEIKNETNNFVGCRELVIENDSIKGMKRIRNGTNNNVFMENYVMTKGMLLKILDYAIETSSIYSLMSLFEDHVSRFDVLPYKYEGYLACINSLKSYFDTSMELIDQSKAEQIISEDWPIYTKTNDSVPAFYSKKAKVKNSIIANGCVIQGDLENCIIGRCVKIKPNVKIKNSIILPFAVIGENSQISYTVVDKRAAVKNVNTINGDKNNIMYVKRRDTV
ncbi:MAG: glucose-1-phosphate adenylyltransferase subunit GlgD [Erysipelotrichaceae bacterium]